MTFQYRARDSQGQLIEGISESSDLAELRRTLTAQKLFLIEGREATGSAEILEPKQASRSEGLKKFFAKKIKLEEVVMFFQQLQTIYVVGMPIVQGLDLIAKQTENERIREITESVARKVTDGIPMFKACSDFPELFAPVTISLLEAGEVSGRMEELLGHAETLLREQSENRMKIKSTLFYPKIVFGMIGIVFVVAFYFVMPKIKGFYRGLGSQLPAITRFMLGISDFLVHFWWAILLFAGGAWFGFVKWSTSEKGRNQWDAIKLKTPVFGRILLFIDVYNFCSVLGLLLASGLPIMSCFDVVRGSMANAVLKADVLKCKDSVQQGRGMREGMEGAEAMPKLLAGFVALGEETGEMEKTLRTVGTYYKTQVDYRLDNLSKAIEPALLVIIFGMVLVLALSIYLPIWRMGAAVTHK